MGIDTEELWTLCIGTHDEYLRVLNVQVVREFQCQPVTWNH